MPRAVAKDVSLAVIPIRKPVAGGAKVYSASEALLPALRRTYFHLFQSFHLETFFKLAAVALVCEGFVVSFKFVVRDTQPLALSVAAAKALLLDRDLLPVTIFGGLALMMGGIYCFYLLTYLRFGFFHSVVHQTQKIGAACKLYSKEAERLFAAGVMIWGALLVAVALLAALVVFAGYTVASSPAANGRLDPGNFLILFFPCIGFAFALLLAICAAHVILNDFILPHMAVEGASFKKAWADVRARLMANKETFLSFFVLRLALPVFVGLVVGMMAWLVGLAVFGLLDMSAAGFNAMLDGAAAMRFPAARFYVLTVIHGLFDLLGIGAGLGIAAVFGGPLGVFMRSYALFYYGGHYKALGNLLEPGDV
jgi:hypothetical protein